MPHTFSGLCILRVVISRGTVTMTCACVCNMLRVDLSILIGTPEIKTVDSASARNYAIQFPMQDGLRKHFLHNQQNINSLSAKRFHHCLCSTGSHMTRKMYSVRHPQTLFLVRGRGLGTRLVILLQQAPTQSSYYLTVHSPEMSATHFNHSYVRMSTLLQWLHTEGYCRDTKQVR